MSQNCIDWIDFNQKNKPQGNAVSGGIMVMLVSGLQVGWIFNNEISKFPWAEGHSNFQVMLTYASFYIAAIVGLSAASMIMKRLTKTNVYVSCIL